VPCGVSRAFDLAEAKRLDVAVALGLVVVVGDVVHHGVDHVLHRPRVGHEGRARLTLRVGGGVAGQWEARRVLHRPRVDHEGRAHLSNARRQLSQAESNQVLRCLVERPRIHPFNRKLFLLNV